jgi:hypothetical protein
MILRVGLYGSDQLPLTQSKVKDTFELGRITLIYAYTL